MCKAPFLAVSPGRCPGPLAASSHRAKSIRASRRSGRIMRSLPERPTRQLLFHPKSPCCNQRHSFLFIFRELTGKTKWTKFYAKDWSSEVLPFGFFSSFIPRNIYFPVALHSGGQGPQAGVLQRQKRTRKSLLIFLHFHALSRSLFFLPSRSEEFANVLNKNVRIYTATV